MHRTIPYRIRRLHTACALMTLSALASLEACNAKTDEPAVLTARSALSSTQCNDDVAPICSQSYDGYSVMTSFSTQVGCGAHSLTLKQTQTLDPKSGEMTLTVTIQRKDELILTATAHAIAGTTDTTVDYGSTFEGIEHSHFVTDGQFISGEVDGRKIKPLPAGADPLTITFADGLPSPNVKLPAHMEKAIGKLQEKAASQISNCLPALPVPVPGVGVPPVQTESNGDQDPGHGSNPENSFPCVGCLAGCAAAGATCGAAVVGGCTVGCAVAGPFFGVCFGICVVAGSAACAAGAAACVFACNLGGAPCCPVQCGTQACCLSGETCLNSAIGLCCSPGKFGCNHEHCCVQVEDSCIDQGPNEGTCCPAQQACGPNCCGSLQVCANFSTGECCLPASVCNGACCGSGEVCTDDDGCCLVDQKCGSKCCPIGDFCVDPAIGLCNDCPPSQIACNAAGGSICCDLDAVCCPVGCCAPGGCCSIDGTCLPPLDKNCIPG